MNTIKIDPSKLLGFKIIANGETSVTLHSAKIGVKGCTVFDTPPADADAARALATSKIDRDR